MENLSNEVLVKIFNYLPVYQLQRIKGCSRRCNEVATYLLERRIPNIKNVTFSDSCEEEKGQECLPLAAMTDDGYEFLMKFKSLHWVSIKSTSKLDLIIEMPRINTVRVLYLHDAPKINNDTLNEILFSFPNVEHLSVCSTLLDYYGLRSLRTYSSVNSMMTVFVLYTKRARKRILNQLHRIYPRLQYIGIIGIFLQSSKQQDLIIHDIASLIIRGNVPQLPPSLYINISGSFVLNQVVVDMLRDNGNIVINYI